MTSKEEIEMFNKWSINLEEFVMFRDFAISRLLEA